eukprot:5260772-Pleurochrysis_carterae.AAC.1
MAQKGRWGQDMLGEKAFEGARVHALPEGEHPLPLELRKSDQPAVAPPPMALAKTRTRRFRETRRNRTKTPTKCIIWDKSQYRKRKRGGRGEGGSSSCTECGLDGAARGQVDDEARVGRIAQHLARLLQRLHLQAAAAVAWRGRGRRWAGE